MDVVIAPPTLSIGCCAELGRSVEISFQILDFSSPHKNHEIAVIDATNLYSLRINLSLLCIWFA